MDRIIQIFEQIGALLKNDHFVYSSGRHGEIYINKNDFFAFTAECDEAGKLLAARLQDQDIETVAGPAMCGILPGHWTAYHLSKLRGQTIYSVFAERDNDKNFAFLRGYDKFVNGKKVFIVDDICTSGGTLKKFITTITNAGGLVVGAAVLVNRTPSAVNSEGLGVPLFSLAEIEIPTYAEQDCPLCKRSVPINTTVGHGREYLSGKGRHLGHI